MKNESIEKEILDFIEKYNDNVHVCVSMKNNRRFVEYLDQRFPMLKDRKYTLGMKLYWLVNGIEDFPKCTECGKPNRTSRCNLSTGYATSVCSLKCSNNKAKLEKTKKTNIERYGVDNCQKNSEIRNKTVETVKSRYGTDNPSKNKDVVSRIFTTKLERYGNGNYTNSEKSRKTNLEKYGCESVFSNVEIQKKIKKTMLERHGHEHPMECPDIRRKSTDRMTEASIHNSYVNYLSTNPYSYPNFTEEYYLSHRKSKTGYSFICRKCGRKFISRVHNGCIRRCPECYPTVTTSIKEQELFDFIKSVYNGKIERKNRTLISPRELDIFLEDRKLAIEFDGLYWHSELNGIDEHYHVSKSNECLEKGIQLIHVFEDEWDLKQEIVKSRIKNLLGIYDKTVFARKCRVSEIDSRTSEEFVNSNHLQGAARSSFSIGLFFENELVSVMTFCKPRIALGNRSSKEGQWELLRFCNRKGYHVVGGAGKLLKFFERSKSPKKIITYADRRWSVGKLYEALGFTRKRESGPNYWYLDNGCDHRMHRFNFRKSVLSKKLKKFDPNRTEVENMKDNRYTRIFDCGNIVYEK